MKLISIATAISLALTASANLDEQHFTINYGGGQETLDLMRSIASASRANDPQETALREQLKELRDKKPSRAETDYETVCRTSAYFTAEIYPLDPEDLHPQIAWAATELEEMFTGHPYPGDYNQPKHPDGFRIVRADHAELPGSVQQWISDHPEQKSFCVKDGVAFFAPGIILEMLGLFAGEGEGECKGQFPTDPEAYFQEEWGDIVFGASFLGTSEIGNTLTFQAVARKLVRKPSSEKTKETVKDEL